MKTYELVEGLKQEYKKYTSEDHEVWNILFDRQMEQLEHYAHPTYLNGLDKIGFQNNQIPDYTEVNKRLDQLTGWQIEIVPGIINEGNFFRMLAEKRFPSSTWLRKKSELDYLSEPDMFHDGFGHVPMLTLKEFCDFYQRIGEIGLQHLQDSEKVKMLGRIYWFTVEFGLIGNLEEQSIYGAGIISSIGETKHAVSNQPIKKEFDVVEIMNTDFNNTVIQNLYFVIESFGELLESTKIIESHLKT